MTGTALHRAFVALHLTLGAVIALESIRTLVHALSELDRHYHLALLAGVETVAALLFLWPRTLRLGGGLLVAVFLVGASVHLFRGEFPAPLLVYGVATVFVMVHGYRPASAQPVAS